jgi:hypothetical protein
VPIERPTPADSAATNGIVDADAMTWI